MAPRLGGVKAAGRVREKAAVVEDAQMEPVEQFKQRRAPKQQAPIVVAKAPPKSAQASLASMGDTDDDSNVDLPLVDQKYLSDKKFADLAIGAATKRALAEVLKYERCSLVQAASIPVCLGPDDVIAKAKTGTGKTLAFMIPALEKVLRNPAPRGKVSVLVLSPTRELARQIQTEAHKLLTFQPQLHSMVVYGGVDVKKNIRAIKARMPDILVATPGRCWDLLTQTHDPSVNSLLDSTRVLVLDEADNLLDMGFRPQITKILNRLPPPAQRQTYLFSATFPTDVKSLANVALKREHKHVDAVGEDVATHSHVEASSLVVPPAQLQVQLLGLLAAHMAEDPEYKIIVFLPTANLTAFFADLFTAAGVQGVMAIHSRKSQAQRDKASAQFRAGSRMVLFSSDVSARGVDYPNVSYVVQCGAPSNREQYIHRAGRTGRAGRAGQGTLLLSDFERPFLNKLQDLPITPVEPFPAGPIDAPPPAVPAALARDPAGVLARATASVDYQSRAKAYQSFLGYYKSHEVIKLRSEAVVATANAYAAQVLACASPPGLLAKTVGKMGLKGVAGVNIVREGEQFIEPGSRGGGGGGGGYNGANSGNGNGGGRYGGQAQGQGRAGGGQREGGGWGGQQQQRKEYGSGGGNGGNGGGWGQGEQGQRQRPQSDEGWNRGGADGGRKRFRDEEGDGHQSNGRRTGGGRPAESEGGSWERHGTQPHHQVPEPGPRGPGPAPAGRPPRAFVRGAGKRP
ncbi:hypothetical protein HYH03_000893 [Edaphochlamys debaryana]|uniref:ATP-dependent RNA helicase n=1 Tax=Edaphochlamys debaryana TaxID=47281 RepID=A0A835YG10_9CHLO|nr:hypothetical protein HYH03_000893 [Edaphochlamys debaryana]|eukprot:KAG2501074.1 hypothetical protein HYH03_000893 [Edaphochlamys debaryana]